MPSGLSNPKAIGLPPAMTLLLTAFARVGNGLAPTWGGGVRPIWGVEGIPPGGGGWRRCPRRVSAGLPTGLPGGCRGFAFPLYLYLPPVLQVRPQSSADRPRSLAIAASPLAHPCSVAALRRPGCRRAPNNAPGCPPSRRPPPSPLFPVDAPGSILLRAPLFIANCRYPGGFHVKRRAWPM